MNIQEKLLYIQQNLKAPKSQYNKFGDFHYRTYTRAGIAGATHQTHT